MTGRDAGLVVRALGSRLELDTRQTQYRGHAGKLAAASAADGYDLVVTFSGDGTVNEVVNGLMQVPSRRSARPSRRSRAAAPTCSRARSGCRPTRAGRCSASWPRSRPGTGARSGSAWPATATSRSAPASGSTPRSSRTWSGSGRAAAAPRWRPTCGPRCAGTTGTDRRRPALTLRVPGQPPVNGLFMGVVTNSSPWTYLGSHPVRPAPHADFSSGLDLFALRRMRTLTTLAALGHMMQSRQRGAPGRAGRGQRVRAQRAGLRGRPPDRLPHRRRVPGRDGVGRVPVCARRAVCCSVT